MAFLFVLTFVVDSSAQGRRSWNWYFGDHAGITFRNGIPEVLTDGALSTDEGCASFSNPANGSLYFYTDGETVYNRDHKPMPNGTGLNGDASTSQSALILPWPDSTDLFVILNPAPITSRDPSGKCFCLSYSVVDMRLDSGRGDVVSKNNVMFPDVTEHVTATAACLSNNWWVIAKTASSSDFVSFHLTNEGFNTPPTISSVPMSQVIRDVGQMHTSPDGRHLIITGQSGATQLYRILRTTGEVFDGIDLFNGEVVGSTYGCTFSSDSRAAFVAASVATPQRGVDVYRFMLDVDVSTPIPSTREHIGFLPGSDAFAPMQLGPDGRIYVGRPGIPYLAMITAPSDPGVNLVDSAVTLSGICRSGLPNFTDWILGPHAPRDSSCLYPIAIMQNAEVCAFDCLVLTDRSEGNIGLRTWAIPGANPPTSNQDKPRFCFPTSGDLGGSLIVSNDYGADTTFFIIRVKAGPELIADSIVYSCKGAPVRLFVTGASTYEWFPRTGLDDPFSASPLASPLVSTTYTVIGKSGAACDDTTTVRVEILDLKAGPDLTACTGGTVQLSAPAAESYQWEPAALVSNPNARNPTTSPLETTTFYVTMVKGGCTFLDTVVVTISETFAVSIDGPSTVCSGQPIILRAVGGGSSFTWKIGATTISDSSSAFITVTEPTTVILTAGSGDCVSHDTLRIDVGGSPTMVVSADTAVCTGSVVVLSVSGDVDSVEWTADPTIESINGLQAVARPLSNTSYIVTGISAGGCRATDTIRVTIIEGPVVSAGPDRAICKGEAVRLGGVATADSFQWIPTKGLDNSSSLTPMASPLTTTTYRLIATRNGCTVEDSVTVTVSSIELTSGSEVEICNGSAIELDAGSALSYLWSPRDGLSDPTISNPVASPKVTTRYQVIGEDLLGCVDTTYITVRVIDTISVALEVGTASAEAGSDSAAVPIFLVVDEDALPVRITKLRAAIVHDASAYLPDRTERGLITTAVNGSERISYFDVRDQLVVTPRQRITSIIGTALLGNVDEVDIRIEDATWEGLTCPITNTKNGRLYITGCNLQARVLRMFDPTRVIVAPQPGSDVIDVTIEGGEPGAFTIQLFSVDGSVVRQEWMSRLLGETASLTVHVPMNEVPSGLYHVVTIAPSGPHVARVVWLR